LGQNHVIVQYQVYIFSFYSTVRVKFKSFIPKKIISHRIIEITLIFIRGWQSLDSNSGYPATRGLSTGGWREHLGVPVAVSPVFYKKKVRL